MSRRMTGIAVGVLCAAAAGCSLTEPASGVSGTYLLEHVIGRGPATGKLILTRQGYAERRVRFKESDGTMSDEYLARGTVEFRSDSTIYLSLREMNGISEIPWTPDARLTPDGVQISYQDVMDGSEIVETYRRE